MQDCLPLFSHGGVLVEQETFRQTPELSWNCDSQEQQHMYHHNWTRWQVSPSRDDVLRVFGNVRRKVLRLSLLLTFNFKNSLKPLGSNSKIERDGGCFQSREKISGDRNSMLAIRTKSR